MRNVVVGVDGTPTSLHALAWAAETVGHDGRVHAVVALNPWTEAITDLVTGEPVAYRDVVESALIEQWTSDAGFAVGELATSVSSAAMAPALDRAAGEDHADATRSAVRFAAHLSRTRQVRIELLHALGDAPVFQAEGLIDLARYESGTVDQSEWEVGQIGHFAELMQVLAGPELDMVTSTPPGLAALCLEQASERSALLVLGRHRSKLDRGFHTAQPLRHALTHARCPVAVIAEHPADDLVVES